MKKFLFLLNILAVIALLWAYMSPFISPSISPFFALFGLLYPIILLINILFALLWLFVKPKFAWLGILAIGMGYGPLFRLINFNIGSESQNSIEILSYNLGGNQILHGKTESDKKKKFQNFNEFTKAIKDVDILCFQELGLKTQKSIQQLLSDYYTIDEEYRGTKVYSKFPIVNSGNIKLESLSHNAAWVDLEINSDTIRVYSIHLSSNRVSNKTDGILEEANIREPKFWNDVRYIFSKYAHHATLREKQIHQILAHADHSPYPIIICGDFNDVPQSNIYRIAAKDRTDSFIEAGKGIGSTYRLNLPALRIDYIFADSKIKCIDHKILKYEFSDHFPIMGVMSIEE